MGRQAALIALLCACDPAPPYGEVLVEVDAEPSVPRFLSRLRIDLYAPDGTWYQSRDVGAASAADWPLSFSLFTDERSGKSVRLRLRGYPEGAVRDFRGERFQPPPPFVDPPVSRSLAELCANPPVLPPNQPLTQRHGAAPLTELVAQGDCAPTTKTGSVAARIVIPESALYHFEVVAAQPDGSVGQAVGDTTLFLRSACADPASQVACSDDIDPSIGNLLSRFDVQLDPGDYFLLTGGKSGGSPADLTLAWARADQFGPSPAATPPPEPSPDPRDTLTGGETPSREPQPNLAIDLLADVRVEHGRRRTAAFLLRGECLGTQADLRGGSTCVDTAGVRAPVAAAALVDGIHHSGTSRAGTWAALEPRHCTGTPRPAGRDSRGQPLHDEEVCVSGGGFTLGQADVIGLGTRDGRPGQVAVVEPFLLDRFEFTVARYRQALSDGFVPPDAGPTANEDIIRSDPSQPVTSKACTWSVPLRQRETMPLNCVSWYTARALCRFLGGDLPSHVEWEYAASSGPDGDLAFPWGNQPPDCCQAVFGRGYFDSDCLHVPGCPGNGFPSLDEDPWKSGDISPFGVVGMGGSMTEFVSDAWEPYTSPCWWQHPLRGIACEEVEAPHRSVRGGNWETAATFTRSGFTLAGEPGPGDPSLGFRCMRRP